MSETNEVGCVLPVKVVSVPSPSEHRIGAVYVVGNPDVNVSNTVPVKVVGNPDVNISNTVPVEIVSSRPRMRPPVQDGLNYRIVTANGRGSYRIDELLDSGWARVRALGEDGRTPIDPRFAINLNLALEIHELPLPV